MAETPFRVEQIDHVELFVPDRRAAASWFEETLGLRIMTDFESWATDRGPLMISSDGGNTKLALFRGEPRGSRPTAGHHRVAFRVDGAGFLAFLDRLERVPVLDDQERPVTARDVVDHDRALSIYFCDPWGNRFEITTYDVECLSEGRE